MLSAAHDFTLFTDLVPPIYASHTLPADFQERLRYYSLRKQLKQRAAAEAAGAGACTFRPDTGNAVQVLALSASRAGNLLEPDEGGLLGVVSGFMDGWAFGWVEAVWHAATGTFELSLA